jgi:transglutaminase-like putative cysteine protease
MNKIKNQRVINFSLSFIYLGLVSFFIEHLPLPFIIMLSILCGWNIYLTLKYKQKPNAWLANGLAAIALIIMLLSSIGFKDTVVLFVAMLLLSCVFKLLQAKTKQHYQLIITLTFFSLSAVYLFSQTIFITLIISTLYILNFAVLGLLESSHSLKLSSKQSAKIIFLAFPLAVVLLIFLPKLPAFWQLPGPKMAQTGLSEQVDPFDIAKLSNSDELVFRAKFDDNSVSTPYYWRAIVHDEFDGKAWKTSSFLKQAMMLPTQNSSNGNTTQYSIIAEPAMADWLYGLGYANSNNENVVSNSVGLLRKKQYKSKVLQYSVSTKPLSTKKLNSVEQRFYKTLTVSNNQKSYQLAQQLKNRSANADELFNKLLDYFSQNSFSYTLTPTPMRGDDTLDQFMFNNKRGFCGHYASAAAFIFRSAGVPARVVSGYLGGEHNQNNDYITVRQYDAHAWVEVYTNAGWRIFDATAVVAPERLNGSLSQSAALNDEFKNNINFGLVSLSNYAAINWLRLELENLDYQWSSWVLGFDKNKQQDLLASLFGNTYVWLVPLGVIIVLILSFSAYFIYINRPKATTKQPPLVKEYYQILSWANKHTINYPVNATPIQTLQHISQQAPYAEQQITAFCHLFEQVRYARQPFTKERKNQAKDLIKLIKSIKQRNL